MVFPSDVSVVQALSTSNTCKRWQSDGPEGQQLKNDVVSSFQDGSLDVANPDFMALYRKAPAMYGKFTKQVFRNHAKAAISDLVSLPANTESTKGECRQSKEKEQQQNVSSSSCV
jgi:hypothetical protein